jgi:AcrR family transcriptional regulator
MTENASPPVEHHQKRVGQERRERTRALLIRSAIGVFATRGPDAPVIDDFIAAAGVARGTFYNYFRTTHELLAAVTAELNEEVLGMVNPQVAMHADPAVRVCVGTRLYVQFAARYPMWGAFLTRIGPGTASQGKPLDRYLMRDLEQGIASRRFAVDSAQTVRDMILGLVFFGIETLMRDKDRPRHIEHMLHVILVGCGLPADEARAIAHMPLQDIGPVSAPVFATLEPKA